MPDTLITANINRHLKVRKPDSPSDLDVVKERIFNARGAVFPDLQCFEVIEKELATPEFRRLASRVAQSFLGGHRILVVGKSSSEVILSLACIQRGIRLLSQAMRRTRDVVMTSRGDLGAWRSEPEVTVLLGALESGDVEMMKDEIRHCAPDLVLLLNPPKGKSAEIQELISSIDRDVQLATVAAISGCIDHIPGQIAVEPQGEDEGAQKKYTLCCILHFLLLRVREEVAQSIASHPRSQALVAQLQSSGLDTNAALVGLSIIVDDMPLSAPMRLLVRSGLEQINRGWSLPSRTAHSRGLLSYGLRSLLTECGADYPFTSKEIDLCLSPLFRVMAQIGECDTLIDCLLTNDRKIAKDKSAKAALLAAQNEFFRSPASVSPIPTLTELSCDLSETFNMQFQLRTERNDSLSESLLPVVAEQNCSQFGGVYLLASSKTGVANRVLCHLRSQSVHLGDALVSMSYESNLISYRPEWHADTLYASLELDETGLKEFEAALRDYLQKARPDCAAQNAREESDGPLTRNHRVFPLAHWIERQPWGKGFPEPVFEQEFRVCKVLTHMDSHQHILVDDASNDFPSGEGFVLVWRNSVNSGVPSIRAGQTIHVRYNLLVDREKSSNDIFGLVNTLSEVGDQ